MKPLGRSKGKAAPVIAAARRSHCVVTAAPIPSATLRWTREPAYVRIDSASKFENPCTPRRTYSDNFAGPCESQQGVDLTGCRSAPIEKGKRPPCTFGRSLTCSSCPGGSLADTSSRRTEIGHSGPLAGPGPSAKETRRRPALHSSNQCRPACPTDSVKEASTSSIFTYFRSLLSARPYPYAPV